MPACPLVRALIDGSFELRERHPLNHPADTAPPQFDTGQYVLPKNRQYARAAESLGGTCRYTPRIAMRRIGLLRSSVATGLVPTDHPGICESQEIFQRIRCPG